MRITLVSLEVGSLAYLSGTALDLHAAVRSTRLTHDDTMAEEDVEPRPVRYGRRSIHQSFGEVIAYEEKTVPGTGGLSEASAAVAAASLYLVGVMPFFVVGSVCFLREVQSALNKDISDIVGLCLFIAGGVPFSLAAMLDVNLLRWRARDNEDGVSLWSFAVPVLPAGGVVIWTAGCALYFPGEVLTRDKPS